MSDAEGLTARFKEISSQLDLIVSETEEAINSDINQSEYFVRTVS